MTIRALALGFVLFLAAGSMASAQDDEELAFPDETAKVTMAVANAGCRASGVEKESARLFETDDARCETGRYDIKLDGGHEIGVMTLDG